MVGAHLKYLVYSRSGELIGALGWQSAVERLNCRDRLVGLEGRPGSTQGLELLPIETVLKAPKTTTLTKFCRGNDQGFGYENVFQSGRL